MITDRSDIDTARSDRVDHETAESFFGDLERAWNSADGAAYGRRFAEVADFVDIRGVRHHGTGAVIGHGHQAIFDTVYRASTIRYRVDSVRRLDTRTLLVHATATLDAPAAPPPVRAAGAATSTAVLTRGAGGDDEWLCTAFHNTLVTG
jgi:uncharacterized protein (TIGR02246 family)